MSTLGGGVELPRGGRPKAQRLSDGGPVDGAEQKEPALKPGDVVGERYRVLEPLGTGGMGAVYRVEHTLMGKEMAMKLLRPELSTIPQIVERFEREARSASMLDSIHIVRVTDFGRTPSGGLFLVMELLEGESLAERMAARGALPVEEAIDITDQILTALEHAHSKGVVHRDLKPDNMMLVPRDGRMIVKILDFGLAKITSAGAEAGGATLTQAGMVFGTPRYMAPEQAAAEPVDERTDLYAVGVLLFELLKGRPPFEAGTAVELLTCHLTQAPPPLELSIEDKPLAVALEKIIFCAMEKQKKDRFPSASLFREALVALRPESSPASSPFAMPHSASGVSLGARIWHEDTVPSSRAAASQSMTPLPPRELKAPRRKILLMITGAVAVSIVAGILPLRARRDGSNKLTSVEDALSRGDLPAARAILGPLLASEPKNARAQALLGHLHFAEDDLDGAIIAYKTALELDGSSAGDVVMMANARRMIEKSPKLRVRMVDILAEHAGVPAAPLLSEIATSASEPKVRRRAYRGLERLGETDRIDAVQFLADEIERAESCKARKWYVDRLAVMDDPRVLGVLKRERQRRGGLFNLEYANGCMEQELKAHIANLEKKE